VSPASDDFTKNRKTEKCNKLPNSIENFAVMFAFEEKVAFVSNQHKISPLFAKKATQSKKLEVENLQISARKVAFRASAHPLSPSNRRNILEC
jgi:hypothetical protein